MNPSHLPADDSGSTLVEFGVCVGTLTLLIAAAIEFGVLFLVNGSLESAVLQASRYGITGFSEEGVSREDAIMSIIEDQTLGLVDMSKTEISTKVYKAFDDVGKPEPFTDANGNGTYDGGEPFTDINGNGTWDSDMGAAGLGGPGDVVVYTVTYPWTALTPLLAPILDGAILSATVSVRNEPWGE